MEIPVVPLDGLETNPDGLRRACHTVGLFYLDLGNHALPRRALAACAQFFALPDGAKAQMDVSNSPQWRGYIALGRENTQGKPDWREQVEFGAERPPLAGAFDAGRPLFERLIGPNQWYGARAASLPPWALWALPCISSSLSRSRLCSTRHVLPCRAVPPALIWPRRCMHTEQA